MEADAMLAGRIYTTATIANAASLSGAVDLDQGTTVAIVMPATWTAANLTLQASVDGTTYGDVYEADGTEVVITAAASRVIRLDPAMMAGFRHVKIRSGTSGTPVAQGGARSILLLSRSV